MLSNLAPAYRHIIPCLSPLINIHRMSSKASPDTLKNVLKDSKSPYLLQHKDNPVHWQEWSKDTLALAKTLDRPIFLSSGYSACHWCHILAHESFEDEGIAKLMNDYFVNIKLDREERPDIDRIYMTYLQATQGGGGWPLSVFMTPNLEPFFAGTYFPQRQFRTLLLRVHDLWENDRERCEEMGKNVVEVLKDLSGPSTVPDSLAPIIASRPSEKLWGHYVRTHDPVHGGFGPGGPRSSGPKFPSCALTLEPLSRFATYPPSSGNPDVREEARRMGIHMLRKMWEGGIHDWVGGGFARYSVDEAWMVPHFEKMLYDQAQMMSSAVVFAGICVPEISRGAAADELERDKELCETIAIDVLKYLLRDLQNPEGAFFSAEDADSAPNLGAKKAEGAFYLWTKEEFDEVVGEEDKDVAGYIFGILPNGNVPAKHDAHGEMTGKNILYKAHTVQQARLHFGFKPDEECPVQEKISAALEKLRQRREATRERPGLDDKIICSWNGLMISSLSRVSTLLDSEKYPIIKEVIPIAEKTAKFIKENMWDAPSRTLYRSWRQGRGAIAQTDDYACLIKEVLDLYEATGKEEYAIFARDLQVRQDELFWDEDDKGYFVSSADDDVLVRLKDGADGAEPSAASNSVHNLLRLCLVFTDEHEVWETRAYDMIKSLSTEITNHPMSVAYTVAALMDIESGSKAFYLIGRRSDPFVKEVKRMIGAVFKPHTSLIIIDPEDSPHEISARNVTVREILASGAADQAGLMICEERQCGLPIRDLDEVRERLRQMADVTVGA